MRDFMSDDHTDTSVVHRPVGENQTSVFSFIIQVKSKNHHKGHMVLLTLSVYGRRKEAVKFQPGTLQKIEPHAKYG